MKSRTTLRFRDLFNALPVFTQRQARSAYRLFLQNPRHPSLHFKRIHPTKPIYSARINLDVRALGILDGSEIIWFWIGSHTDYDNLITRL